MKNIFILCLCLSSMVAFSQVDKIHVGSGLDEPSAIFQLDSSEEGLLMPRLTFLQSFDVVPNEGLMYYNENANNIFYYDGSDWILIEDEAHPTFRLISDKDSNTFIDLGASNISFQVNDVEKLSLNQLWFTLQGGNNMLIGSSISGAGSKFLFNHDKYAIRIGTIDGDQWDDSNIGLGSFASGVNTTASGVHSVAWGEGNLTSGPGSLSFGKNCIASGISSVAWGIGSVANDNATVAFGFNSLSSGAYAACWNLLSEATAINSTAWGNNNIASAEYSTAFGKDTEASASYATSWGLTTTASGDYSTAFGVSTVAPSYAETAFGTYPILYTPSGVHSAMPDDRVFVVGNGTSDSNRSNAVEILKNGAITFWGQYQCVAENAQESKIKFLNEDELNQDTLIEGFEFIYDGTPDLFHLARTDLGGTPEVITTWQKDGKMGVGRNPTSNLLEVDGTASKSIAGNWIANSDRRLKKNIEIISNQYALDKVLAMRGVEYYWNDESNSYSRPISKQHGFIAQELAELFPSKVVEDEQGYLMTSYGIYDAIFVQAFKEQQSQLLSHKNDSSELKSSIYTAQSVQLQNNEDMVDLKNQIVELEKILNQ